MDHIEDKATMSASLDGKPAHQTGGRANAEKTCSFYEVSSTQLKYTIKLEDKPLVEGDLTVSADDKVMKYVNWLVTQPAERQTEISRSNKVASPE